MVHKNNMAVWDAIECQRGHTTHESREITVDLGVTHGYRDLPQVPKALARSFTMNVWPPDVYPVDGGPYCPAHDAVSATIVSHRIWEPRETILTLAVCTSDAPGAVVDFGAQLGWYTLLAGSCGRDVVAFEADPENRRLLGKTVSEQRGFAFKNAVRVVDFRIDSESPVLPVAPIRFAKLDMEGSERDAVRMLWPSIEAGLVDHMLIEISPVFDDYYPQLVVDLIEAGFDAYLLPGKSVPPPRFSTFPDDLEPLTQGLTVNDDGSIYGSLDPLNNDELREQVASWHQEDVWFARRGARW